MSSDVSLSMSRVDLEVEENVVPSPQLSLRIHLCASKFYCTPWQPFVSEGIELISPVSFTRLRKKALFHSDGSQGMGECTALFL